MQIAIWLCAGIILLYLAATACIGLYCAHKDNAQLITQASEFYHQVEGWKSRAETAEDKLVELERRPKLDDWTNGMPGWDYDAVLREHGVEVAQEESGWSLSWKHGCMHIGQTKWRIAREAAAVFVSLWLLGVSASMADTLMEGYITHLEAQG